MEDMFLNRCENCGRIDDLELVRYNEVTDTVTCYDIDCGE